MMVRMQNGRWRALVLVLALLFIGTWNDAAAQRGPQGGRGMGMRHGGMMRDADHQADMQALHTLFDNRERITRRVTVRPDGVESVTESDDLAVAQMIRTHVESMMARVKEARPIHQRDPLFREIFKHADKIVIEQVNTPHGVRVVETSTDPYVARLIQAHADVVTAFIANGRAEAMKNHPVPERSK